MIVKALCGATFLTFGLLCVCGTVLALLVLLISLQDAQAADVVTVPVGDWMALGLPYLTEIIVSLVLAALARLLLLLPHPIATWLRTQHVEQVLRRAVDYGINSVAGATKGAKISKDVGPDVVNEAAQYVIDMAPKLAVWLGGRAALEKRILARLDLEPAASAEAVVGRIRDVLPEKIGGFLPGKFGKKLPL